METTPTKKTANRGIAMTRQDWKDIPWWPVLFGWWGVLFVAAVMFYGVVSGKLR